MDKHHTYPTSVHRGNTRKIRIRKPDQYKLTVEFKKRRLVTENRYELIGTINDIVTTICFLIGSYFFFTNETKTGTIMFIIGNANTLFRAILRILRKFHVEWISDQPLGNDSDDYSNDENENDPKAVQTK